MKCFRAAVARLWDAAPHGNAIALTGLFGRLWSLGGLLRRMVALVHALGMVATVMTCRSLVLFGLRCDRLALSLRFLGDRLRSLRASSSMPSSVPLSNSWSCRGHRVACLSNRGGRNNGERCHRRNQRFHRFSSLFPPNWRGPAHSSAALSRPWLKGYMLFMRGREQSSLQARPNSATDAVWRAASHHRVGRMNCCSSRRSGVAFARGARALGLVQG